MPILAGKRERRKSFMTRLEGKIVNYIRWLACQRNETTLILSWLESAFKLDLKIPTHTFPREILHFILHYYTHLLPMVR